MADSNRKGLALQRREELPRGRHYSPREICLALGVTKTEYKNHQTGYVGTMQALVASGLATEDMFPGQPGQPLTRVSYRALGAQECIDRCPWGSGSWTVPGYVTIHRRLDGTFRIDLTVSYEEQAQRNAANERGREREGRRHAGADEREQRRLAEKRELLELACLPRTHEAFRAQSIERLRSALTSFREHYMGPSEDRGFRYDEGTITDFNVAAEDLFEILQHGTTLFSKERHAARIAAIKGETARADAPLQRFLATAQSIGQGDHLNLEGA